MRKLAITLALATTALATPALARDNAWYVGVEGGAMIVEDHDFDLSSTGQNILSTDNDYGWDVDATIGYDFGPFRVEAEVGYREASVDAHQLTIPVGGVPAGIYENPATGDSSALSFMANGLIDFGPDDGAQGFVGGGVGVARVKYSDFGVLPRVLLDDSDTVFAWQVLAGVRAPLSDNVDVSVKYRFFNADDVTVVAATGASLDSRFRSHSILGGLTFNFGEPAAPPPPPP
ncbi:MULTISPECIES: outer membrane protein, partial [unclassified Sphingomonas]